MTEADNCEMPCPETSDGYHCGHWYDTDDRACCACWQVNWANADEDEYDAPT